VARRCSVFPPLVAKLEPVVIVWIIDRKIGAKK
jgi:hypothetical protein